MEGTVAARIQTYQQGDYIRPLHTPSRDKRHLHVIGAGRPSTVPTSPRYPRAEYRPPITSNAEAESLDDRIGATTGNDDTAGLSDASLLSTTEHVRPSTPFDATLPELDSTAQGPTTPRRERNAKPERERRLSEVRASLRCIDEPGQSDYGHTPRRQPSSHVREREGMHGLQRLIDDAIDANDRVDATESRIKQSPSLRKIASEVEFDQPTAPVQRANANGSPVRRRLLPGATHQSRMSLPDTLYIGGSPARSPQRSPRREAYALRQERSSTESGVPRRRPESSMSFRSKSPYDVQHLHAKLQPKAQSPEPSRQSGCASPVKERAAVYEIMASLDEQTIKPTEGGRQRAPVKMPWWLEDPPAEKSQYIRDQGLRPTTATSVRDERRPLSPPEYRTGPIPLALPRIVSARQRPQQDQHELTIEAPAVTEASLSRLPSRAHSARNLSQHRISRTRPRDTHSPMFKWGPFMVERKSAPSRAFSGGQRESSLEVNQGSETHEDTRHESAIDQTSNNRPDKPSTPEAKPTRDIISDHLEFDARSPYLQPTTPTNPPKPSHLSASPSMHPVSNTPYTCPTHRISNSPAYKDLLRYIGDAGTDLNPLIATASSSSPSSQRHVRSSSGAGGKQVTLAEDASGTADDSSSPVQTNTDETIRPGIHKPVEVRGLLSSKTEAPQPNTASPVRGRAVSRDAKPRTAIKTAQETDTAGRRVDIGPVTGNVMGSASGAGPSGSTVTVSRSRSRKGGVRVTVEVRTPRGSPVRKTVRGTEDGGYAHGVHRDGDGEGEGVEDVLVVTTLDGEE